MKTETELQEILGDGQLAYVSAEYFSQVSSRIDMEGSSSIMWTELLAFQNGWLACKEFYGIST